MRILVIEDEPQLSELICRALVRHGHTVKAETDGESGLSAAINDPPDLVVLDLGLPRLDGLELLARLRKVHRSVRVVILSARSEVAHRISGLHAGADDYLPKPFSMDELAARVAALGRRTPEASPTDTLVVGDLRLDIRERQVFRAGQPITLSPREFDLLKVLMQEPGRTFSRTELCERVWQREHQYETRTVEIFVTRLRKKIEDDFGTPLIHTVRTLGYSIGESSPAPTDAVQRVVEGS